MSDSKKKTKIKDKSKDESAEIQLEEPEAPSSAEAVELFNRWESEPFVPDDFMLDVPIDSLESAAGYTSLLRQMQREFIELVAYYRSPRGGALSLEEARAAAFHKCKDDEEGLKLLDELLNRSLPNISFTDLAELRVVAPRVAERFWEEMKIEGQREFESGHLAANFTFPAGHLKGAWNIAKFLGVRESFLAEWQPRGGIELSLIDMLVQAYFQWQYWLEQTITRSQTRPREEHHAYQEWKKHHEKTKDTPSWKEGYWFPSYVTEHQDIDHAAQMADRFNKMYMRTLRQLTNLRRTSPLVINNPNQVNLAANGGQQVNVANESEEKNVLDYRNRRKIDQ